MAINQNILILFKALDKDLSYGSLKFPILTGYTEESILNLPEDEAMKLGMDITIDYDDTHFPTLSFHEDIYNKYVAPIKKEAMQYYMKNS